MNLLVLMSGMKQLQKQMRKFSVCAWTYLFASNSCSNLSTAMQIEGWSSKVYKHFKEPVIIIGKDGAVKYKFFCKQYVLCYFALLPSLDLRLFI